MAARGRGLLVACLLAATVVLLVDWFRKNFLVFFFLSSQKFSHWLLLQECQITSRTGKFSHGLDARAWRRREPKPCDSKIEIQSGTETSFEVRTKQSAVPLLGCSSRYSRVRSLGPRMGREGRRLKQRLGHVGGRATPTARQRLVVAQRHQHQQNARARSPQRLQRGDPAGEQVQQLYYQYVPDGKEYPILCRKLRPSGGLAGALLSYLSASEEEQQLLDWNEIAEKFGYVHIGSCRISPDHRFIAYTLDTSGGELFSLEVKDLQSKNVIFSLPDNGIVSLAWARNSDNLFYTVCDETLRPNKVFCKKMQSDEPGFLVFTEKDVNCCVDITSTKDFKYITVNSNTRTSSEVYVMESGNVREGLWPVQKRTNTVQYFLEHHNDFFYILTNAPLKGTETTNEGYYLARCRAEKSLMDRWQVVALPGSDCTFQDMDIFHEHLVLFLRKNGLPLFCSIDMPIDIDFQEPKKLDDLDPWFFPIPSNLCSILPGPNNDFTSSTYRLVVSSPVIPDLTVDYDMRKKTFTILHQEEITGLSSSECTVGLQSNVSSIQQNLQLIEDSQCWSDFSKLFCCERVQVISHDGVSIPLVILYSRETHSHGESPGILYGYGAYGEDLDKSWCSDRLSLLARGWVLAFADVRGGGDSSWHRAGTKANKINSIQDFAACGMHLIKEGFVHKSRLCAIGCSAGGLLVGAVINMLPDLFSAAVLKVPFLDICNTMLDSTLPLTILDYEEFGDPNIPVEFDVIHSYSPYDNLSPGVCYPPVLVTASFNDTRVGVWEAVKWVSKVRDVTCQSCSRSVILKTNMQSGHFGEGGRFTHCDETAFEYAFLMKALGMDDISAK